MDLLAARQSIERCLDVLCATPTQRVIFDEFDAVFQTLDLSLFRCLRAIRDAHKEQISYIVTVIDDLACQRNDIAELDHFFRLVRRNVCGLGPYCEADARQMMSYLISRRSIELDEPGTAQLVELCGGHAGLLKTILSLLGNVNQKSNLKELAPSLKDEPAVQAECKKIWDSLSESEHAALHALACGGRADPNTLRCLKLKGLVRESRKSPLLFSPLFADFCRQQIPPSKEHLIFDRSLGIAMIDGQRVRLTELQFEILCYLYEHRGQVCTKDELIENVYRQQHDRTTGSIDDARLQTLISRLRVKVEPPRYIRTVRGEGYKFIGPDEP